MKLFTGLVILALATGMNYAPVRSQDAAPDIAGISDEVDQYVRRNFFDPNRLPAFEAAARDRDSSLDWIRPALAALGASHTGRYTPDQIDYYEVMDAYRQAGVGDRAKAIFPPDGTITYPGIGLVPRIAEGRTYAAYIYDGSPADEAGIRPGDEILAVGGAPLQPIGSFRDHIGQTVEVRLRRRTGGDPVTVQVPVVAIQPAAMLRNAIRHSVRILEKDGKRLAYVRIWTYAVPGVQRLLAELLSSSPIREADGLILDMRGRWGGAPPDAAEMFVGRSPSLELIGRNGRTFMINIRWSKPLVGIIDGGARSGMEILAFALKKAGVPLIGTRTAGAVLAGRAYVLGDNSLMLLAVSDVRVDGERLEGVGVTPTIEVPFDLSRPEANDPQLDRAAIVLSERLRS